MRNLWRFGMLDKWSKSLIRASVLDLQRNEQRYGSCINYKNFSIIASATQTAARNYTSGERKSNLNLLFWSKPCSLALAPDSPLRVEEPKYEGIKHILLKLLLFYSKQSKSIRGANVVYHRIISQVDRPAIYDVFQLEKTFRVTFALLVLHMWLCLRRLKEEGKEGTKFGQHLYEIYNHDLELRVSKAGVNLLLSRWMKDLEKIFYGNVIAYDASMLPAGKNDALANAVWRNIFADDVSQLPSDEALKAVQAMSRYIRRESACLSLTDKDTLLSGNFTFTSLEL